MANRVKHLWVVVCPKGHVCDTADIERSQIRAKSEAVAANVSCPCGGPHVAKKFVAAD